MLAVKDKEKKKAYDKARYLAHKEQITARANAWKKANPERWKYLARNSSFRTRYGVTVERYEAMFFLQEGKCAICLRSETARRDRKLAVDHDHFTGKVRGLLCGSCNRAIGLLQHSVDTLDRAKAYLEVYSCDSTS